MGGALAGPARSDGVSARSATALRADARAGVDVVDLAEAGDRPPPAGPRRRRLSKSATKTPTEPERARRNVDIPRLRSPPIPVRSAFVADLDTTSPRVATEAPPATRRHPRITFPEPFPDEEDSTHPDTPRITFLLQGGGRTWLCDEGAPNWPASPPTGPASPGCAARSSRRACAARASRGHAVSARRPAGSSTCPT